MMKFDLLRTCAGTGARAGILRTAHGEVPTPAFMPVATKGSVRGLPWQTVDALGASMVLANTYHLYLRPGPQTIAQVGGLQKWTKWPGPFLTDSGGYQVFSFARRGRAVVSESGVTFKDDLVGDRHHIGPRESMYVQEMLGADVVMAFDDCPPANADYSRVQEAVERTSRWTQICLEQPLQSHQSLFPIVQGGIYDELRRRSLEQMVALDAPGYAIGGVSVGESRQEVYRIVREFVPALPSGKPRYLMGVGTPADLLVGVAAGTDMFDCVLPTRLARHGSYFREDGRVGSITRGGFETQHDRGLVDGCSCPTCSVHSRAYLKHLFLRKELTCFHYLAVHNLHACIDLLRRAREAVLENRFPEFMAHTLARQEATLI